ncbi:MAG: GatB/YqeY domain-containing protein [Rhizobiaceae bacterium]|nr:GatB/YqeY domain-containing protein [Rhizobiaceae bacterium]
MREKIATALKDAINQQDKHRVSTLRLIQTAIQDRDVANRSAGKDPISEGEIAAVLVTMLKQRKESVLHYEESSQLELAQQERDEMEIIRSFLPKQLSDADTERLCAQVVNEVGAGGLRDMGRCMNALKTKYPGQMDFSKASGIVKDLLR